MSQEQVFERQPVDCVNLQILRASHLVLKTYDDAYRPFGIRATQLPVLDLINRRSPVTIKVIAAEVLSERSVLSRKLAVMVKNGWVEEVANASREKAFAITATGRELLESVRPVRDRVQQELMEKLSADEQALMLTMCDKLQAGEEAH